MRIQNKIIYKEIVLSSSNNNGCDNIEKDRNVGLLPFPIRGFHYNIPPKIFNKSFLLEQIHLFYRSDEHKVILTQERNDYPLLLTESNETVYDYGHDQFLINIELSKMGKGYVGFHCTKWGKLIQSG